MFGQISVTHFSSAGLTVVSVVSGGLRPTADFTTLFGL